MGKAPRVDGLAYVRHRRGEAFTPRRFEADPKQNPGCLVCARDFVGGEPTVLIPVCPAIGTTDLDDWCNWMAAEVHEACAEQAARLSKITLSE